MVSAHIRAIPAHSGLFTCKNNDIPDLFQDFWGLVHLCTSPPAPAQFLRTRALGGCCCLCEVFRRVLRRGRGGSVRMVSANHCSNETRELECPTESLLPAYTVIPNEKRRKTLLSYLACRMDCGTLSENPVGRYNRSKSEVKECD